MQSQSLWVMLYKEHCMRAGVCECVTPPAGANPTAECA